MPAQPTAESLHINHYLSDMAIAWVQDESKFVAGRVFPTLPVQFKSEDYPIYERGYFYRCAITGLTIGSALGIIAKVG